MSKHIQAFVLISALAVVLSPGCSTQQKVAGPMGPPPLPALVAKAESRPVQRDLQAIGNVEPSATVSVKAQVAGDLMSVRFAEGQNVKKGDLLFEIDPRPYQDALNLAQASVARDRALLQQAEANLSRDQAQLRNAKTDAGRNQQLVKEGIVAQSQYDTAKTNADVYSESARADQAAIGSARASLEADAATVERAKLDLSYCQIHAPIGGRTGNVLVQAGNYVKNNGDTTLVVINQIEPVFVSFSVPEEHLAAIRRLSNGRPLPVYASTKDNAAKRAEGQLHVIDNTVDTTTGTIRLKATFANGDAALWPGQFVNVTLGLETVQDAVLVPSEAVQAGQKGPFIYVVKADDSVEARQVSPGQTVEGKIVIESGLKAGETVVVDGQLLLAPGAHIMDMAKIKAGKS